MAFQSIIIILSLCCLHICDAYIPLLHMRHSKNLRSNLRLYDGQVETPLEDLFNILERAAETKDVDGDICVSSLLDLEKTMPMLYNALEVLHNISKNGGYILFVGTKRSASDVIATSAKNCGQYYVNHRWFFICRCRC